MYKKPKINPVTLSELNKVKNNASSHFIPGFAGIICGDVFKLSANIQSESQLYWMYSSLNKPVNVLS